MARQLRVTMPDGSKWDVPLQVIAESAVAYYPTMTITEALDDEGFLIDWAANNMNWDDVVQDARKADVGPPAVNYQDGWVNGEKEIVSVPEAGDGGGA